MMFKKLLTKTSLVGSVLGAVLTAGILIGCSGDTAPGDGRDSDGATASQATSESEGGGSGEHGRGGGAEGGGESAENADEGSEEWATAARVTLHG